MKISTSAGKGTLRLSRSGGPGGGLRIGRGKRAYPPGAPCPHSLGGRFQSLHAEDAAQALDVLENNQSHVDVLFTDLRMRDGMSGLELARVAKRKDPDLRVVITSG